MSWKPGSQNRQWRRPKQDDNDDNEYPNNYNYNQNRQYQNNYNNYNNRPQRSYNSQSNYGYHYNNNRNNNYNRSNYRNNTYESNKPYQSHQNNNNQYKYNRYNQSNNAYNQNNNNQQQWINKNSKDVHYVKNTGKFQIEEIPINELTGTLQTIWDKNYHKNVQFIEKIIFLSGPPGCGKTSICNYVEKFYQLDKLNHNQYTIDVSTICGIVMKQNNKALIVSKVYGLLFRQILQNEKKNKILIIDGFLRKEQHVYVTNFLKLYMKDTTFIFLVADVDENTSCKRQLERGKKLVALANQTIDNEQKDNHKKTRLKDSDLYEHAARNRYQKYYPLLQSVRYQLKHHMKASFDVIDANQSLSNVYQNVEIQLKKQDLQHGHTKI